MSNLNTKVFMEWILRTLGRKTCCLYVNIHYWQFCNNSILIQEIFGYLLSVFTMLPKVFLKAELKHEKLS